jgi:hypothetical protein
VKTAREILSAFVVLILAYLLLVHAGGFAQDIRAIGSTVTASAKVLQGR